MFCPRCGTKIDDGINFCTECGASLGGVFRYEETGSDTDEGGYGLPEFDRLNGGRPGSGRKLEIVPEYAPGSDLKPRKKKSHVGIIVAVLVMLLSLTVLAFVIVSVLVARRNPNHYLEGMNYEYKEPEKMDVDELKKKADSIKDIKPDIDMHVDIPDIPEIPDFSEFAEEIISEETESGNVESNAGDDVLADDIADDAANAVDSTDSADETNTSDETNAADNAAGADAVQDMQNEQRPLDPGAEERRDNPEEGRTPQSGQPGVDRSDYSYTDVKTEGNNITITPNGGMNGSTVLAGGKDLKGLLDYVDSEVLEKGRTINRDFFYDLLAIMLVDKDLNGDFERIEKNTVMALAMANNFHDTDVKIRECNLDANNAAEYRYQVTTYGRDDTWIANYRNRTLYLNNGATQYSSDMFADKNLAVWMTAVRQYYNR